MRVTSSTSLPASEASAAELEALWRGHWTIENKVHYVRDVSMGEDDGQAWTGNTPGALAALRNGVLSALRAQGVSAIADALAEYAASPAKILGLLLGTTQPRQVGEPLLPSSAGCDRAPPARA